MITIKQTKSFKVKPSSAWVIVMPQGAIDARRVKVEIKHVGSDNDATELLVFLANRKLNLTLNEDGAWYSDGGNRWHVLPVG